MATARDANTYEMDLTALPNAPIPDTCQRMELANLAMRTVKLDALAQTILSENKAAILARKLSSPNKARLETVSEIMRPARMATTTNGLAMSKTLETKLT